MVDVRLDPMLTAMRDPALRPIMRASRPRLLAAARTVLDASGHGHVTDTDLVAHVVDAALLSGPRRRTAACSTTRRGPSRASSTTGAELANLLTSYLVSR